MGSRGRPLAHGAPAAAGGGCVVRLRGLPFDATEDDVATFLRGIAIRPHGVHLVYANDDRPSGLAYVEVETPLDVDACLGRDQQRIGHRYIEVFRSSFAEMSTGGKAPSPERSYAGAPIGKGKGFKGSAPSHRGGRAQADAPFHPYGVPITRGRR
nr:hnRNP H1 [Diplonema papillatum]